MVELVGVAPTQKPAHPFTHPPIDLSIHPSTHQVIPADYAFVLHTADPITGDAGTLFGEVVSGMGEALVGNHPGRWALLRFVASGMEVWGWG